MRATIQDCLGLLSVLLLSLFLSKKECLAADAPKPAANSKAAPPVTKKIDLPKFNGISLAGIGDLYIQQSTDEGVTVEADDTLLPLIKVEVQDKTLYLDLKNASQHTQAKIKFHVNVKDLQKIDSNTSSTIFIKDPFKTDTLNVYVSGLGEADLNLNVNKLNAKIDGGAKIEAKGIASEQTIVINGAGVFNGAKLTGQNANSVVSGSGIAKINVTASLTLTVSDDGIVKYCGRPVVNKQTSGSSLIRALSKTECK